MPKVIYITKNIISQKKDYDTPDSQDVSVPSTKEAQRCLTCQIGRDGVLSTQYGRKHKVVMLYKL
jgi:hypothetical protein